jgi:hypothetical protein
MSMRVSATTEALNLRESRARSMERLALFYLPPLLCMGLIFYLSSCPWVPIPLPGWVIVRDKIAHAILYAFLAYLWIRAFRSGDRRQTTPALLLAAVLITVAYGISDEYHQSFVPGRTCTAGDALADSVGAVLAAAGVFVHQRAFGGLKAKPNAVQLRGGRGSRRADLSLPGAARQEARPPKDGPARVK